MKIQIREHPQLRPGEVWLATFSSEKAFDAIKYKTKRMGSKSKSPGSDVEQFPVFVSRTELAEKGFQFE